MKMIVWITTLFSACGALASTNAAPLAAGSPAPAFAAVGSNGQTNRLADFRGKWVVLYFYPKAFTPGCTAESCSLRDGYADIQALGAVILGVSLDSVEKIKKFKDEYHLPFELLSDADKAISRAYESLALGGLFAKRRTFIIDPEGKIAYLFENVNVKQHDAEVKAELQKIQAQRAQTKP